MKPMAPPVVQEREIFLRQQMMPTYLLTSPHLATQRMSQKLVGPMLWSMTTPDSELIVYSILALCVVPTMGKMDCI